MDFYLSSLAKTNADWSSVRQSIVASNVANANTPGFKAKDVEAFDSQKSMFSNLAQTDQRHLASGIGNVAGIGTTNDNTWDTYHSGGNVSLPQEMLKAGEIAGAYELNTTVMKSFHRMLVSVFGAG